MTPKGKYGCRMLGGVMSGTEVTVDGKPMCKMCYKETSPGIVIDVGPVQINKGREGDIISLDRQITVKYKLGRNDVVAMVGDVMMVVGDLVTVTVGDDGYPINVMKNDVCLKGGYEGGTGKCSGGPMWVRNSQGICTYCPRNPQTQCTFAPSKAAGPYRICHAKDYYQTDDTANPYGTQQCAKCT